MATLTDFFQKQSFVLFCLNLGSEVPTERSKCLEIWIWPLDLSSGSDGEKWEGLASRIRPEVLIERPEGLGI